MAVDEESEAKPKGSPLKKILLFVILPLFLVSGTVSGLFVAGVFSNDEEIDEEELAEEEDALGPAVYVKVDPAFVVNFVNTDKARFLQITLEIMTRQPNMTAAIESHMPVIRNNLVLLFGSQSYEDLSTLEGKEYLREQTLSAIQEILEEETGDPIAEAVYFTSLVMQ